MLKRSIAVLLLLAMVCANFSRFFVFAGFEMNRAYIAKQLCENRNRPEMHCNGKCFLKKKLQAAEEKEKKQERENQRNRYQEVPPTASNIRIEPKNSHITISYPERVISKTVDRSSAIFQPPRANG